MKETNDQKDANDVHKDKEKDIVEKKVLPKKVHQIENNNNLVYPKENSFMKKEKVIKKRLC